MDMVPILIFIKKNMSPNDTVTWNAFPEHIQVRIDRIEQKTRFLDSTFTVPGTNFRFGWDPIIGLIPYVGDFVGSAASLYIVYLAANEGASGRAIVKMLGNVLIDTLIGFIPVLGLVWDFTYKANDRNVRILKENIAHGKNSGSGLDLVLGFIALTAIVIAGLFFLVYLLLNWVYNLFV